MYVLIDRGQKAITHKHAEREVLNALAWIECSNDAVTLPIGNPKHWAESFSVIELRLIYKHATGADLKGYGNALAVACNDMARRLPESVVNPVEVRAQRKCIMDGDKAHFEYQPGMLKPIHHPGEFSRDPLKCERDAAEEARCAALQPSFTATQPVPLPGGTAGANPFTVPPPPVRTAGAPRAGGVREIVFRVADEIWNAAGKPTDLKVVLDLRKQMMAVLESEHQVKKTTSSTTLGAWQKERI